MTQLDSHSTVVGVVVPPRVIWFLSNDFFFNSKKFINFSKFVDGDGHGSMDSIEVFHSGGQ